MYNATIQRTVAAILPPLTDATINLLAIELWDECGGEGRRVMVESDGEEDSRGRRLDTVAIARNRHKVSPDECKSKVATGIECAVISGKITIVTDDEITPVLQLDEAALTETENVYFAIQRGFDSGTLTDAHEAITQLFFIDEVSDPTPDNISAREGFGYSITLAIVLILLVLCLPCLVCLTYKFKDRQTPIRGARFRGEYGDREEEEEEEEGRVIEQNGRKSRNTKNFLRLLHE